MNNIFFVDPMSFNNLGEYDYCLLSNLKKFQVSFYCNKKYGFPKLENVETHPIFNYQNKNKISKALSYCISLIYLFLEIQRKKPNILHLQWFKLPLLDFILLKSIKYFNKDIRLIFTAHNVLPHDSGDRKKSIYRMLYNILDGIIVHESHARNKIHDEFNVAKRKVHVIRHGYFPMNEVKKKSNLNQLIFGLMGHLNPYKGVDLLCEAWGKSELLYNDKSIKLILAGKLDNEMGSKIKFVSNLNNVETYFKFLSEEEFDKIFDKIDILILPYREISQSGLLLKAIGAKKPFIVSNKGGLTEPLKYGDVGWVLEDLNVNGIINVVNEISKNKIEFSSRNESLEWIRIQEEYSWENIGFRLSETYNSLIQC